MNYLDYREALGIGFEDESKAEMLKAKIVTFFEAFSNFNDIKKYFDTDSFYVYYLKVGETPINGYYSWGRLADNIVSEDNIKGIVCRYVTFVNSLDIILDSEYNDFHTYKGVIKDFLYHSLNELNINYKTVTDDDGIFVFPDGAKELDDALVSEPYEWLKDYPKTRETFGRALKQYSNGDYVRDVADNFRKALEEFFQEFLGNTRNLANNKTDICKYLGTHNAEPEIASMMQALLNSYDNLNNSAAKHNDKMDAKYLEFLMYQTGLFIRMIITVGKEEQNDNDI